MAQVDTRIPFMAFPQQNILEAYYGGKKMKQEAALGAQKVQGGQNELLATYGRMLAQGVLDSENPAAAYPQAMENLRRMLPDADLGNLPTTYEGGGDLLVRMGAMGGEERSKFERLLNDPSLTPEEKQNALRVELGLNPPAGAGGDDAVWRQKMNQMVEMGMPPHIASGIATGRYKLTVDEVNGTRVVTDLATGQPVDYGQGAPAPAGVCRHPV